MHRFIIVCGTIGLWLSDPDAARAQTRDTSGKHRPQVTQQSASPACCAIVRIDAERSIITARETATGYTFRFAVKTRRLLGALKVGQPVWADFAAKTVKLKATDATPCCGILDLQETP